MTCAICGMDDTGALPRGAGKCDGCPEDVKAFLSRAGPDGKPLYTAEQAVEMARQAHFARGIAAHEAAAAANRATLKYGKTGMTFNEWAAQQEGSQAANKKALADWAAALK